MKLVELAKRFWQYRDHFEVPLSVLEIWISLRVVKCEGE